MGLGGSSETRLGTRRLALVMEDDEMDEDEMKMDGNEVKMRRMKH